MERSEPGLPGESMADRDVFGAGSTAGIGTGPDRVGGPSPDHRVPSLAFSDPMGYSGAVRAEEGTMVHPEPATTINP